MTDLTFADRVEEFTTVTGLGAITLDGATPGRRSFVDAVAVDAQFYYTIESEPVPDAWEVGIGTLTATGTIERSPIRSSSSDSLVNFAAGTKRIALTVSAEYFNESFDSIVSRGDDGTRYRATLGDSIDGGGVNNRSDLMLNIGRFQFAANHAGSGAPYDYVDDVGSFTMNMDADRNLRNNENGGFGLFFESKFWFGGRFNTEMQMCAGGLDGSARRVFQGIFPENGTDRDAAQLAYGVDRLIGYDFFGEPRFDWDLRGGVFNHAAGTRYRFASNNTALTQQLNAAGNAYISLPYIDNFDNLVFTRPLFQQTPIATNLLGVRAAYTVFATSGQAEDTAIFVACPAIASGDFYGQKVVGNVAGRLAQQVYNSGLGSSCLDLQVQQGAGNDCQLSFSNIGGGTVSWTIGYDNSDADKMKIEASRRTVGNAAALFVEFDPAKNISYFAKPPKLPSYVVAALPSAVTVGAGALAFCTDETGGAVPVFSDGSDWRRMTDRAVVVA